MTIAYDAKRAFLNERGLGNYSRTMLQQLAAFYPDNRYVLCTPSRETRFAFLLHAPFETLSPRGMWHLSPSLWRRRGIACALKGEQVDIYHGLSQELPVGIEDTGCLTVVTMHDAIFLRYPELYSPTYVRWFTRKNEEACRKADILIAISEQTKRDYMQFFHVPEEKIRIVYQGCNEVFWKAMASDKLHEKQKQWQMPERFVLSVGALESRKNMAAIIEAIADARLDIPLVIVGKGKPTYRHMLQDQAARLGVTLRIVDNATLDDLPAFYRSCSVFVYPSLFEGFGIPVLEAARCGAPIVASGGICFEEIAGEGALYVKPQDITAIGAAIRRLIEDANFAQSQSQIALQNTERFCQEKIVRHLWQTYTDCLAASARGANKNKGIR